MRRYNLKDNNLSIKQMRMVSSVIYVTILLIVLLGSFFIIYKFNEQSNIRELADEHFSELDIIENEILNSLELAIVPINLYDSGEMVTDFFKNPQGEMSTHFMLDFENFISNYCQFNQLRLLDTSGQELLRADNIKGEARIVSKDELQNKGDRYYFKDAMALDAGIIYVSRFDLNMENGQVEVPHRPMIRFAKKVLSPDNETLGLIVVNYQGKDLLDNIKNLELHEEDQLYIVNHEGYNLYSPEGTHDFAFMFEDEKAGFFTYYPEVWSSIQEGQKQILTNQSNFYIRPMTLLNDDLGRNTSENIYLVIKIPKEEIISKSKGLTSSLTYAGVIFIPLFIYMGIQLGIGRANRKWYQNELIKRASLDALTGLYNRSTILDYLKHYIEQYDRTSMSITIAFIDINNLKKVNDEHGHEKGDEMIISFSDIIKSQFRKTDLLSRIGGDEFLVIFVNSSEAGCIHALEQAYQDFKQVGLDNIGFPYEFSYGITSYKEGESLDELVDRADNLMYIDKRKKKSKTE